MYIKAEAMYNNILEYMRRHSSILVSAFQDKDTHTGVLCSASENLQEDINWINKTK